MIESMGIGVNIQTLRAESGQTKCSVPEKITQALNPMAYLIDPQ